MRTFDDWLAENDAAVKAGRAEASRISAAQPPANKVQSERLAMIERELEGSRRDLQNAQASGSRETVEAAQQTVQALERELARLRGTPATSGTSASMRTFDDWLKDQSTQNVETPEQRALRLDKDVGSSRPPEEREAQIAKYNKNLQDFSRVPGAFVRGVAEGGTAGLVKYPAAALMLGVDKVVGDGQLTYEQALAELRAQRDADRERNPIASYGSQIAGSLAPQAAAVKLLGGGAKAIIGAAGGYGAVQGATENAQAEGTTLRDAAIGGGLGLAGGAAAGAVVSAARSQAVKVALPKIKTDLAEGKIKVDPQLVDDIKAQVIAQGGPYVTKAGKISAKGEDAARHLIALRLADDMPTPQLSAMVSPTPPRSLAKETFRNMSASPQNAIAAGVSVPAIIGAAIGSTGQFHDDRLTSTLLGLGGGAGLSVLGRPALQSVIDASRPIATRMVGTNATPIAVGAAGTVGAVTPVTTEHVINTQRPRLVDRVIAGRPRGGQ